MLEILIDLARVFRAHDKELYMVGGTVRDLLMRRESSPDMDLTTNARPDEIKRFVNETHPVAVVSVGEQFGTIRVHYARSSGAGADAPPDTVADTLAAQEHTLPSAVLAHTPDDVDVVEITTYRADQYTPDSRKPEVTFGDTLQDDLLRRDFTINAMARDPLSGEIIDPYGGREDLERHLIRAVGDEPERRFDEDPLRMLRAARFAAQFGFEIEAATAHAIERQAATLTKISFERIRDEFTKLLVTPDPARGLRLLVNLGLMRYIVPEVLDLKGVSQQPTHSKDVYEHVLRVVERIPPRPATRWAALLHDIAKPRTKSVEDGKVHFFGHEDVGAVMARDILRRLKFDKPFISYVSRLVRLHMRANAYLPDWTDGAVRRLMLDAGDGLFDLLDLSRADITSYRPERVSRAVARVDELEARCRWLQEEAQRVPLKSPLDGNDLMELFGRGPGPWLRPIKDYLLGLVLDGQLAPDDRETAAREARKKLAEIEQIPPTAESPTGPVDVLPPPAPTDAKTRLVEAEEADRAAEHAIKRVARAAARRQSRTALPQPRKGTPPPEPRRQPEPPQPPQPRSNTRQSATPHSRQPNHQLPIATAQRVVDQGSTPAPASRDDVVRALDEYLQVQRFRDVAPNGMQVIGKAEVRRVALGVSANLELFEAAAARSADMIVVHHGLFLERDPHPILARLKRRLRVLFEHDMTLLGYHLPLDAHPEIGNNVLWLRRLGFEIETLEFGQFQGQHIGAIGVRSGEPLAFTALVAQVAAIAGGLPRVYHEGPEQVRRLAVVTGDAPGSLNEAIARGCDAYLTGEAAEGTQAIAREEQTNFLAAGHYNTERLGVEALGAFLRERFGVETFFIDVANDV